MNAIFIVIIYTMNECYVYHLDYINKCMHIFVDKPNESFN